MKRASLNHVYRLVWNELHAAWVAVPETAKARCKGARTALLAAALLAPLSMPLLAQAAPTGGVVTSGAAAISQAGTTTTINQSTQKASINWQGFSIASNETVNFNQPNSSAITLNRVIGNEQSLINGTLNANGQVFLINSNGVLFGKGASVNVGGLVASTRDITDTDFNAGNYNFNGSSSASVINLGTLTAKDGGYIALLGNNVSNQGVIVATQGTVALAAGDKITLNFNGDSLLSVTLDEGTLNALVENKQAIYADGGKVILTAKAADDLLGAQVNNSGIIRAQTIDDLKGSISLYADGGTTNVDGTLDASAPNGGDGGNIETSGSTVNVADTAKLTTLAANGTSGTWLIDPTDFTIAASGGNITGTALSSQLANTSVTISSSSGTTGTSGNVNVNDAISWSAPTTLTLNAVTDININKPITLSTPGWSSSSPNTKAGLVLIAGNNININNAISLTNAALTMTYGNDYNILTPASYSGAVLNASGIPVANTDTSGGIYGSITFNGGLNSGDALTINGHPYTLIYSMTQFDALGGLDPNNQANDQFNTVTGYYAIAQNLDASGVIYQYAPIYFFGGTLAGLGHKISNFTMDNPWGNAGFAGDTGLIADNSDCGCGPITIRDLGLVNISFTNVYDSNTTGAFLGEGYGTFKNIYSTGTISGSFVDTAGGLVGKFSDWSNPSTITSSFSSVNITGNLYDLNTVGGLAGQFSGTISNSDATGNITGFVNGQYGGSASTLGGLVGQMSGTVTNSYATGNVSATFGSTAMAYATTYSVDVADQTGILGGLLGSYSGGSTDHLSNSFATGSVTGGANLGGLVGEAESYPYLNINNVYATGNVTGLYPIAGYGAFIGGLIGEINFWDASAHDVYTPSQLLAGSISISNVFATGNVSAQAGGAYVGGLIGDAVSLTTTATITNAYATGNVSGGVSGSDVGGLIGAASNFSSISNVYATGNVSGNYEVGGLIGNAYYVSLSNSYATGAASATYQGANYGAAGLIGYANNSNVSNSYYNSDANSVGIDGAWTGGGSGQGGHSIPPTGVTGLSKTQMTDLPYYLNGTITQVLAARAAEAAQVAQAGQVATGQVAQSLSDGGGSQAAALASAVGGGALHPVLSAALDQNIVIVSPKSYGAGVRSVELDGRTFLFEDDTAGTGNAPAPEKRHPDEPAQ